MFTDANGNRKNVLVIKAFCLSLLFLVLFVLAYLLSADIVANAVGADTGSFFAVWLPPCLISLAASLFCCAFMLLFEDKLLVPAAFVFFAAYYLICMIVLYTAVNASLKAVGTQLINLYLLLPTLLGNLASWGIYLFIKRKEKKRARAGAMPERPPVVLS